MYGNGCSTLIPRMSRFGVLPTTGCVPRAGSACKLLAVLMPLLNTAQHLMTSFILWSSRTYLWLAFCLLTILQRQPFPWTGKQGSSKGVIYSYWLELWCAVWLPGSSAHLTGEYLSSSQCLRQQYRICEDNVPCWLWETRVVGFSDIGEAFKYVALVICLLFQNR